MSEYLHSIKDNAIYYSWVGVSKIAELVSHLRLYPHSDQNPEQKSEEKHDQEKGSYVYLYRRMTYKKNKINIFKVGKSTQENPLKRLRQQAASVEILCIMEVANCHTAERELLEFFRKKYKSEPDEGVEAFIGNGRSMIKDFLVIVNKHI